MSSLHPLVFDPIPFERPWGGSRLASLYGKPMLGSRPVGETWEISDRPEAVSVVAAGPLAGRDLRWLMENHAAGLLGNLAAHREPCTGLNRFPWLVKLLDCTTDLSVQVHPSPSMARQLGTEPKSEMWLVAEAGPDSVVWAGLKPGVTLGKLKQDSGTPDFARHLHRIRVHPGDSLFLPSGRLHALGAGLVVFEIQQNSDTTYRLYDWDRKGPDGRPRALHIEQGLSCIALEDVEPDLVPQDWTEDHDSRQRKLVDCAEFKVTQIRAERSGSPSLRTSGCTQVLGLVQGALRVTAPDFEAQILPGGFVLFPAFSPSITTVVEAGTELLKVDPGPGVEPFQFA